MDNGWIQNQIAIYMTNKKLVEFNDKLKPAPIEYYGHTVTGVLRCWNWPARPYGMPTVRQFLHMKKRYPRCIGMRNGSRQRIEGGILRDPDSEE